MNVILALDGSAASDRALDLVAGLPWPAGTTVGLVSVVDVYHLVGPWTSFASYDVEGLGEDVEDDMHRMLEAAAARLAATGITATALVREGRPSTVIVEAAEEAGADLIILGNRGHSPLRTLLLGSTSAEVIDHATCPVLVVRRSVIGRVLLAHDGSSIAQRAEEVLAGLPVLRGIPVEVMSVVRDGAPRSDEAAPVDPGRAGAAFRDSLEASRLHHEEVARAAVARLASLGTPATAEVRSGDPARMLVDESEARGIDLIVMGTHGRTGLARLRLGSVARAVLTHAHCSVMVVHPDLGGPARP